MRAYTIHAPPDEAPAPERFAFVKDGFSWPALLVPILWILWHRLWLTLLGYVIYLLVLAWIGRLTGDWNAGLLAILGSFLFALEANNIRRTSLENRGWREVGGSFGQNLDEAEIRFFEKWAGGAAEPVEKAEAVSRAAYSPRARAHGADEPILGLCPDPER
jgi:hypothetical protein